MPLNVVRMRIVDRNEWLGWRRPDVTASTMGALFGVHPYMTALRLYTEKRGVVFDQVENKVQRRGRWLEPAIGAAVHDLRPDWQIKPAETYLREVDLHIGATPDFWINGDPRGLGVMNAKSVAPSVYERDWADGAEHPAWVTLQVRTEAMLAGAAFGVIAVLVVDPHAMDLHLFDVERDEEAERAIIGRVAEFWLAVGAGLEPQPDYARDAETIRMLTEQRDVVGRPPLDLAGNNAIVEMLEQRAALMARSKRDLDRCDEINNEIKYLMRDAETVAGLRDWRITFKNETRAGYVVPEKTRRVLRISDKRSAEERPA